MKKERRKGAHSCNNTALLKGLFIVAEASPSDYRVLFIGRYRAGKRDLKISRFQRLLKSKYTKLSL